MSTLNFLACRDCGATVVYQNIAGEVAFKCGSGIEFYVKGFTFVSGGRCLTNGVADTRVSVSTMGSSRESV